MRNHKKEKSPEIAFVFPSASSGNFQLFSSEFSIELFFPVYIMDSLGTAVSFNAGFAFSFWE